MTCTVDKSMAAPDVVRLVLSKLCLWDVRSLQHAHPDIPLLVHEHVAGIVRRATQQPRPRCIDNFLKSPHSGFQEVVHRDFTFLRTPLDRTLSHASGGVVVILYLGTCYARLELRVVDPTLRPGFAALEQALTAMWWFAKAATAHTKQLDIRTRAEVHRPVSEVLNSLATVFADRHIKPLFRSASPPGPSTPCSP